MKRILKTFTLICLISGATPAFAQVAIEGNAARADGQWGGELGVGYSVVSLGGFKLTPTVGAFIYQGDNDRYSLENINGSQICRDGSNGQFADRELCDNTAARVYGRLEATYSIPASVTFGAGARYSNDELTPYGTVAFPIAPRVFLKGNVGPDYYAVGLRARF